MNIKRLNILITRALYHEPSVIPHLNLSSQPCQPKQQSKAMQALIKGGYQVFSERKTVDGIGGYRLQAVLDAGGNDVYRRYLYGKGISRWNVQQFNVARTTYTDVGH